MAIQLLPDNFDELLTKAVQAFWSSRDTGGAAQEGARAKVVGGKNLDGFLSVVRAVTSHCGLPNDAVLTADPLTLPGHYRPTKDWDVLIIYQQRLLAALEFKSQVGSFGNNFNNRVEEALGTIVDLRRAARAGRYEPANHVRNVSASDDEFDPRPPFIGYLMVLEDCSTSTRPVRLTAPHYRNDPAFNSPSYADRYQLLCERLIEERLYDVAALLLTPTGASDTGQQRALSPATSARELFTKLAAHLAAALQG